MSFNSGVKGRGTAR